VGVGERRRRSAATSTPTCRWSPTACGGARTGHHDRRRLPLLRHSQAEIHHRGHPGHIQYTRNMVTGASTAQLVIVLVDARHGLLEQSRRHAFLASLLGIQHIVLAVNKMDLIGWDKEKFEAIRDEFHAFAARLDVQDVATIPMSALHGDNVVTKSDQAPWYEVRHCFPTSKRSTSPATAIWSTCDSRCSTSSGHRPTSTKTTAATPGPWPAE